ncbi:dinucleotide-binding protein [Microbacterium sorbitolivorans]|uniref:Diguanylate cyclase n=1 Tax=Microbacterium sorbitolivorans TaxID=1867410 RepID=A0A367Y3G3_9MICO|nr:NADPH-dependent F420 reductase [Microbacterium sorbitolivorans]RCK60149.1 diguanylate cyclase [Microbacterium sorbitolivorans]GGF48219.1 dinucleotide-binding protein [Microbacterium sorbitolivorans]
MATFSIIGTGNMGSAIGGLLAAGGASVQQISHADLAQTTIEGDVVVLAVPFPAFGNIVETVGAQLEGKTVVDITNPLNFETFDSLVVPAGSSAAAELQKLLPNSTVLKAFNTNFAATLASKQLAGQTTTVLVAGDNADAKAAFVAAVTAGGVVAIDAGSLSRAHELEAIGFLQLALAASEKISWTGGFNVSK